MRLLHSRQAGRQPDGEPDEHQERDVSEVLQLLAFRADGTSQPDRDGGQAHQDPDEPERQCGLPGQSSHEWEPWDPNRIRHREGWQHIRIDAGCRGGDEHQTGHDGQHHAQRDTPPWGRERAVWEDHENEIGARHEQRDQQSMQPSRERQARRPGVERVPVGDIAGAHGVEPGCETPAQEEPTHPVGGSERGDERPGGPVGQRERNPGFLQRQVPGHQPNIEIHERGGNRSEPYAARPKRPRKNSRQPTRRYVPRLVWRRCHTTILT